MTHNNIAYAEKRMRQKWHDLVMEEQQGASMQVLERMFNGYMLALEDYNRCLEMAQQESQETQETQDEEAFMRKKAS